MKVASFFVFMLFSLKIISAWSQSVAIDFVEIAGDKIIVHYAVEDSNPSHEYIINLYSSKDNFVAPLTKVTGDVGNEIKPGVGKKIYWNITDELGRYKGDIELELRGKVYVPFIKLAGFNDSRRYKRGKNYPLVWTSGNLNGQVDIELYDGQNRISREANVPNTGKYDWFIHANVKPGSSYRLKFTNSKNRDEVIFSPPFKVVRKIPTYMKVGIVGIVAGAAAVLGSGGGGEGGATLTKGLPGPPLPQP